MAWSVWVGMPIRGAHESPSVGRMVKVCFWFLFLFWVLGVWVGGGDVEGREKEEKKNPNPRGIIQVLGC